MANTKIIINATQHKTTEDQRLAGVIDLSEKDHKKVCELLTFDEIPSYPLMTQRAYEIFHILDNATRIGDTNVMIGGAPFFMSVLENILKLQDWNPMYAFSKRVSEEVVLEDGSVRKENVFKHLGFYEA